MRLENNECSDDSRNLEQTQQQESTKRLLAVVNRFTSGLDSQVVLANEAVPFEDNPSSIISPDTPVGQQFYREYTLSNGNLLSVEMISYNEEVLPLLAAEYNPFQLAHCHISLGAPEDHKIKIGTTDTESQAVDLDWAVYSNLESKCLWEYSSLDPEIAADFESFAHDHFGIDFTAPDAETDASGGSLWLEPPSPQQLQCIQRSLEGYLS